jgi:hypothetical protein
MRAEVEIPGMPEALYRVLRRRAALERMTVEEYLRRMVIGEAEALKRMAGVEPA